ncbi:hypothetical protein OAB57_03365, partial [Bacteriovoracaceae bacterium]|nr:hypothetical protein [Bacteriovoracaceae bacterium]
LVKKLLDETDSYRYKRSQLIIIFSTFLVDQNEWGNASQKDNLAFVAFFHDILLNQELLQKIDSDEELSKSDLSNNDKELVRKHASMTSSYIRKMGKAPIGVDVIIEQHHGVQGGAGFSRNATNLSHLSKLFMIVERLVVLILEKHEIGEVINKKDILKQLKEDYNKKTLQKIISCFDELSF